MRVVTQPPRLDRSTWAVFAVGLAIVAFAQVGAAQSTVWGRPSTFDSVYRRIDAARDAHDARGLVAAARALSRQARVVSGVEGVTALAAAVDILVEQRRPAEALAIVRELSQRPSPEDASLGAAVSREAFARAYLQGARIEATPLAALRWAVRAYGVDRGWSPLTRDAAGWVVRLAYAVGNPAWGREITIRCADAEGFAASTFDLIHTALVFDDFDGAAHAVDRLADRHGMAEPDDAQRLVRARVELALAYRAHGALDAARAQLAALGAHHDLLARVAADVTAPWMERFSTALSAAQLPFRCDGTGGVAAGALVQAALRLEAVATLRESIASLGVNGLTLRARLREAAVLEATATTAESAANECGDTYDEARRADAERRAAALESEAERAEVRDHRRADGLRVEALLVRERGARSAPSERASLAALRESARRASAATIDVAAGLWAHDPTTLPQADSEASGRMAFAVARAVARWRAWM